MARVSLSDAQLVIARSYGFASWTRLKRHIAAIEPFLWNTPAPPHPAARTDVFIRLACLVYGGWDRANPARARRMLAEEPASHEPTSMRRPQPVTSRPCASCSTRIPAIVNVKGGPLHWEPLLYASYSRIDEAGSDRSTLDVARLLLAHGADPNAGFLWGGLYAFTALTGAFGEGEDGVNQPPHPHRDALARLLLDARADPNDSQTLYNRHFRNDNDHLRLFWRTASVRRKVDRGCQGWAISA